ncbi:type 2 lanthipeptide synthetase LanM [Streptomyces sp. NPDC046261]|uniref:type 2 lanthipeptide synthetase LanM n=1 Tax=Streptomyces sp. NPDC046261 TaxID=3157200 RepID=UPI0033E986FB
MTEPNVSMPDFLPFYQHLAPRSAVDAALRDLVTAVTEPERVEEVLFDIWEALVSLVEAHSFRMMIGEFHAFREGLGLPMTIEGDRALRQFRPHLEQDGSCQEIAEKYPVLKGRLESILRNSLEAFAELFAAYAEDRPALRAAGLLGAPGDDDRISTIFISGSDLHNDNRQVIGVRLAGGARMMFKPRALTSDSFVQDLYTAADAHLTYSLRDCIPLSVTIGSHGWQQFVTPMAMDAPDQPARYFYRFGALCAILGSIGASDLHDENVLAHGEHPCVIDTETVMRPDAGVDNDTLPHTLINHAKLSVVSTMLVPVINRSSTIDVLMAGVGVGGDQKSNITRTVIQHIGTDGLSVGREAITYTHKDNVPRLGETQLSATDHYADILRGYFDGLGFVRGDGVLKVLDAYPDMPVRILLRATMVYNRFVDAATHPDYLARPEEAQRIFTLLKHFPDYLSPEGIEYVAAQERASLHRGDIPYFVSRSGSTELATHTTSLSGVYKKTPADFARAGVRSNSERPDLYHRFLLEECFSELSGEEAPAGLSSQSLFKDTFAAARPGTWWPEIARKIAAVGVPFDGPDGQELGWVCGIGPMGEAPTITPGNFVSFHDMGGTVAFLGRAGRHDSEIRPWSLSADRGLTSLVAEYDKGLLGIAESAISGASSLLLTRPAGVDAEWMDKIFDRIAERSAAGELDTDLGNGPAGLLMTLLSRIEAGATPAGCGEERLAMLRDMVLADLAKPRDARWFDVAHGELGLRWACSRIGRVLGDDALVRQSADWLLDRLASDDQTPAVGWCNGAAGLLLSSAEILASAGRQEWLSGGRLEAMADKATRLAADRPVDLSVCHGSSGVIQSLIGAGRTLGDASLVRRAHEHQENVLAAIRANGFFTGSAGRTALVGYMLGWAGVGDTDLLLHSVLNGSGTGEHAVPVAFA